MCPAWWSTVWSLDHQYLQQGGTFMQLLDSSNLNVCQGQLLPAGPSIFSRLDLAECFLTCSCFPEHNWMFSLLCLGAHGRAPWINIDRTWWREHLTVGGEDTSSAAATQDDEGPTSVTRRLLQLRRPESRYTMSDPLNPLIKGGAPSGGALSSYKCI
jgi:hypothetical protein